MRRTVTTATLLALDAPDFRASPAYPPRRAARMPAATPSLGRRALRLLLDSISEWHDVYPVSPHLAKEIYGRRDDSK